MSQVVNWVVAFTTPIFLAHSSYGVYFLFGCSSLCTAAVCMVFMPETRGKTLEDIDASFRRKNSAVADTHELDSHVRPDSVLASNHISFVTSLAVV